MPTDLLSAATVLLLNRVQRFDTFKVRWVRSSSAAAEKKEENETANSDTDADANGAETAQLQLQLIAPPPAQATPFDDLSPSVQAALLCLALHMCFALLRAVYTHKNRAYAHGYVY